MTRKESKKRNLMPGGEKTGFYARVLDEAERLEFESAAGIKGIDEEIAIMRIKIRDILEHEPDNISLLMAVTERLTKMVKAQYRMNQNQKNKLRDGFKNIIQEIAVPLGIMALKEKIGK